MLDRHALPPSPRRRLASAAEAAPRRRRGALIGLVSLGLLLLGLLRGNSSGQEIIDARQESNVKAVYLYSFGRYVTWPPAAFADDSSAFVIGVLGEDPLGAALDQIAQLKKIKSRTILVRRFASLDGYRPCHVLFIAKNVSPDERAAAIARFRGQPVLLVGEVPGFAAQGGTSNFFLSGDTVRIEINMEAVKGQGLEIDARLLSLATFVGGG